MSDSHGGHGAHGAHGGDHVPHILPLKMYFGAFAFLVVLTVLTVTASRFDFGSLNLVLALFIASVKAITVAALFMHLAFDHKFHSVIIGSSLIFLAIFIGFTMFDTNYRGRSDAIEGERPADVMAPFKGGTQGEEALKEKYLGEGVEATVSTAVIPAPGGAAAPSVAASGSASGAAMAAPRGSASAATSAAPSASAATRAAPSASAAPAMSARATAMPSVSASH